MTHITESQTEADVINQVQAEQEKLFDERAKNLFETSSAQTFKDMMQIFSEKQFFLKNKIESISAQYNQYKVMARSLDEQLEALKKENSDLKEKLALQTAMNSRIVGIVKNQLSTSLEMLNDCIEGDRKETASVETVKIESTVFDSTESMLSAGNQPESNIEPKDNCTPRSVVGFDYLAISGSKTA